MTGLIPTRYSDKNNSTFFEVGGVLITISYDVTSKKRMMVLPGSVIARVQGRIGDSEPGTAHEYEIPHNYRVGGEIGLVERGLYGFMDEVVRAAVQVKALESAEKAVEAAEAEHLFFEGAIRRADESGSARADLSEKAAAQARLLHELVDRVVTAVRHLTNVTSLGRDGLEAYQRDRSQALEKVVQSRSMSTQLRVHGILQAVEAFLRYESEGTTEVKALRERTLDYLDLIERRHKGREPALSHEQAHIIVNEFVPAFVQMKKKYEAAAEFPKDVVGHAFGSFFGGGIAGWITLSVFGESVLAGITGTPWDIPGWYIGAAVAFVWPYLRATVGAMTRERHYEKQRQTLLETTSHRIELALPKAP
jgi:hypothetical protein